MDIRRPEIEPHQGLDAVKDAIRTIFFLFRVGFGLLVIGFFFSGVRYLEQYEKGVILRFGAVDHNIREEPGLIVALPYPIDEVIRVPAKRTQTLESTTFWYKLSDAERAGDSAAPAPATLKPGIDGLLVTGDRNILHARGILKYRVRNPVSFLFKFNKVELILSKFMDNAILKVASTMTAEEMLKQKDLLARRVTEVLQKSIDGTGIGVEIDPVDLRLSWPRQLSGELNAVIKANQRYQQNISEANLYARSQENESASYAPQIISDARTWATRRISRTRADAETFRKLYPLYKKNPEVIKRTIHQDRMQRILSKVDEIFIIDQDNTREIRINLPRNDSSQQPK